MDKILHYLKDPKLWELWYIPYYGSCRILSINRTSRSCLLGGLHDVPYNAGIGEGIDGYRFLWQEYNIGALKIRIGFWGMIH